MPRPLGLWTAGAPIFWTVDLIAADADTDEGGGGVRWVVGEINCSCVGISEFQAVCGGEKTLADVSDEDYFDACELTELMGVKAIEMLDKARKR